MRVYNALFMKNQTSALIDCLASTTISRWENQIHEEKARKWALDVSFALFFGSQNMEDRGVKARVRSSSNNVLLEAKNLRVIQSSLRAREPKEWKARHKIMTSGHSTLWTFQVRPLARVYLWPITWTNHPVCWKGFLVRANYSEDAIVERNGLKRIEGGSPRRMATKAEFGFKNALLKVLNKCWLILKYRERGAIEMFWGRRAEDTFVDIATENTKV